MDKNVCKTINKILSGKNNQKLFDHAKQSATDAFRTSSKRVIEKTAEVTGTLICKKITNKITGFQKISETVTNEHDK